MQPLEFTFTPEENAELSIQAASIINALLSSKQPLPENQRLEETILFETGLFDLAALASSTALYTTLGPKSPLFQQNRPDSVFLHNCPTHLNVEESKNPALRPDLFMLLAMTRVFKHGVRGLFDVHSVPYWHQDMPFLVEAEGGVTSLYCIHPGTANTPTSLLPVNTLLANSLYSTMRFGFSVYKESDGSSLLHLPEYRVRNEDTTLARVIEQTIPTDIYYEPKSMLFFRDRKFIHRTGEAISIPQSIQFGEQNERVMLRGILFGEGNTSSSASPEAALATLRSAVNQSSFIPR